MKKQPPKPTVNYHLTIGDTVIYSVDSKMVHGTIVGFWESNGEIVVEVSRGIPGQLDLETPANLMVAGTQ